VSEFLKQQSESLAVQFEESAQRLAESNLPEEFVENYLAVVRANILRLRDNPDMMTLTMAKESMLFLVGMLERDKVASLDALTGIRNRRSFDSDLNDAIQLSRRDTEHKVYHAIMFLDLDYFKQINDTMGHGGGDEALKKFAKAAEAAARQGEHIYRLGGDEFAILLTDTESVSPEHAQDHFHAAQTRFDKAFSTLTIEHKGMERPLQASTGFHIVQGTETADQLKEIADAALYESKKRKDGRQTRVLRYIEEKNSGQSPEPT
jgi:diguanylate cyclase (GGDEF)-like protein